MPDPNIHSPIWDELPPGLAPGARFARLGPKIGARSLGATLYELEPGAVIAPYHLHHGTEELLIVLSGSPRLRTPEGERDVEPGCVVAFPVGPDGAHTLSNAGAEPARFLLISASRFPDVVEYPDTGALLAVIGPGHGRAFRAQGEGPYWELMAEAHARAAELEEGEPG
ncbi:MAG: cupin domain-containing protein [Solirubrobacteraceae bacterium]|nr:cupin domain-containing protein [Solirubrobacteraceae bacterium]